MNAPMTVPPRLPARLLPRTAEGMLHDIQSRPFAPDHLDRPDSPATRMRARIAAKHEARIGRIIAASVREEMAAPVSVRTILHVMRCQPDSTITAHQLADAMRRDPTTAHVRLRAMAALGLVVALPRERHRERQKYRLADA